MLVVLSPAKSLDFSPQKLTKKLTQPEFLAQAEKLILALRKISKTNLAKLMGISDKLATLNYDRYQEWEQTLEQQAAKQAILTFNGGVYQGLQATQFKAADFQFAQKHLRILSGLYGVLKPLDLIQAHRLEMGTRLKTRLGESLYEFWGTTIAESLNKAFQQQKGKQILVNLASKEYFKSIDTKTLQAEVVTPTFKENKDGKSRIIALFAKQARGMMAAWIIKNRIDAPERLIEFNEAGYRFVASESSEGQLLFSRKQPAPKSAAKSTKKKT